ncbi:ABC transporter permease [Duganella sp. HH105]|uniref:ABC transporter permease n=1 Tax=Duganella sp. HH105 TaxID=1781067 RepID=UPI000877E07E|nr:ABC transporter permease [Duganella sp. HH105]OEZ60362.1 ABC-2 family transporter protein [Duganella sp. HH105]
MKILLHLIKADLAMFLRGKLALFWTFAFPLLMLVMQMALFGQDVKLGPVSLAIVDLDRSTESGAYLRQLQAGLRQQHSVDFSPVTTPANSADSTAAQADFVLTVPAGFAANVAAGRTTDIALRSGHGAGAAFDAAYGLLRGYSDAYNLNGLNAPPRVTLPPPPAAAEQALDYRLFLVSGLAGMVILSTSLMGFAGPLVAAREGGMFRMYQLFPMPTGVVVAAWCVSRLMIVLAASLAMFVAAWAIYGVRISADGPQVVAAIAMLALGAGAFLALGLLIAAMTNSVAAATMFCNLLYFPLLFSGNLMVPLGGLPKLARVALDCLPLNAMMSSIRRGLTGGMGWSTDIYSVALLSAMLVACLALSARRFTWMPRS